MSKSPNTLQIDFAPVVVNAFGGEKGYWADYKKLEADGITDLRVTPSLRIYNIDDSRYLKIDCVFDETALPEDEYGMVYGDEEFEQEISQHLNDALGFADPFRICYTEQGMQDDGLISMEAHSDVIETFDQMSNHAFLGLLSNRQITRLLINGVEHKKEHA